MNDSIELEMKMATQLLWAPCASKSISKKGISGAAGGSILTTKGNWTTTAQ